MPNSLPEFLKQCKRQPTGQTEYIHDPDAGDYPYQSWQFVVEYRAYEERGGEPGIQVEDVEVTLLLETVLWANDHGCKVATNSQYDMHMVSWFRAEMKRDATLYQSVREKCMDDYRSLLALAD